MFSFKLNTILIFFMMITFAAVKQAREGDKNLKCNFDEKEFAERTKIFNECYTKITGRPAPEDPSEIFSETNKTDLRNVFICGGQADGTIEADGTTINFDKMKEGIQNSKQPDDVKTALIDGSEECCDAYKENKNLDKLFKCIRMVYMSICL